MKVELVHDMSGHVWVPSSWKKPNDGQMVGTIAERLIEVAGRCCYESMGSDKSRSSVAFHRNLAGMDGGFAHNSVHEHVHFTIETKLNPILWMGVPDMSVKSDCTTGKFRVTLNMRHCLEFPNNILYPNDASNTEEWWDVLRDVIQVLTPTINTYEVLPPTEKFVEPQSDNEAYVSLFLEESLVWSHEQVRHRFNISQRSGRFCDQTDRDFCVHPLLRDYFAYAKTTKQRMYAMDLADSISAHEVQSKEIYIRVVDTLQDFQVAGNVNKLTARKQARSAGRYVLGQGLSTELVMTANIRSWRKIFAQRCHPSADGAIREISEKARELVRSSRYGRWLDYPAEVSASGQNASGLQL